MQRTNTFTYFTEPDGVSQEVFAATFWCRVKLFLETAGPVAVGFSADIAPTLSGRGVLLPSGGPELDFEMQQGDKLYAISGAINRVKFIVVPEFLQAAAEKTIVPGIVDGIRAIAAGLFGSRVAPKEAQKPFCPPPLKPPSFR